MSRTDPRHSSQLERRGTRVRVPSASARSAWTWWPAVKNISMVKAHEKVYKRPKLVLSKPDSLVKYLSPQELQLSPPNSLNNLSKMKYAAILTVLAAGKYQASRFAHRDSTNVQSLRPFPRTTAVAPLPLTSPATSPTRARTSAPSLCRWSTSASPTRIRVTAACPTAPRRARSTLASTVRARTRTWTSRPLRAK